MGINKKITASDIAILAVLLITALFCLIPMLNTLAISFSDKVSAQGGKVFLWPVNFTTNPYNELLKDAQFFRSFVISVIRVLVGTAINVAIIIVTAFPLSKQPEVFPAKTRYMWLVIFLMLFNAGLIPNYIVVTRLGLTNTIWALVLPGAVQIFSIIMLMNFYKTSIPHSLEEAALMDGADPWYILGRIFVPLSKPCIAVVTLWAAVGHWNSYFDGLIYMNVRENYPLQTYIQSLTVSIDWQNVSGMSGEDIARMMSVSNLTFTSAKVVVSMLPILLFYPFIQRFFVTGIVMGAVKE